MGISYNLLALAIRIASGAVYAIILVKPIAHALARAGVLRGTALATAEAPVRTQGSAA
jgi:energy-coupling factor transport system substrate-specific component